MTVTVDAVLETAGTGRYQRNLLGIFGLVWAADAMQVLAVGFSAASIAASFGLTVPVALQTGTLFFLGMMIGAMLFGRLADRFGRRRVLLTTVAIDALFGLASVFAPNFSVLLVFRFITGAAVGGTLPVDYAMMAEFLPPKNRGRWLVMLEGFWAIGTIAVALVAWSASAVGYAEGWRAIFLATAVPALIGFGLRVFVPESPMFLIKSGRAHEAKAVLDRILAANGQQALPADTEIVLPHPGQPTSLLSPLLRRRTLLMLPVWFLVSLAYYGVFTWMPSQLVGQGFGFVRGYGFLFVVTLAQLPGYALAAWGVERIGRKPTLIAFLVLSAAGCGLFVVAGSSVLVAAALILMSFALLGSWGALYAYTPELYPTAARATGMGAAGAMARLGGLLAPTLIGYVMAQGFSIAIGVFALLLLVAALAALRIDVETRQQALD